MVAMSTVGFGDITPQTEAGRCVIIGLILCSVAALPSLVAGVLDTLRKQQGRSSNFEIAYLYKIELTCRFQLAVAISYLMDTHLFFLLDPIPLSKHPIYWEHFLPW